MLNGSRDNVSSLFGKSESRSLNSQVIALASAGGEDDFPCLGANGISTCLLAFSMALRASRPVPYTLLAFPYMFSKKGIITSSTGRLTGVVAA